MLIVRAWGLTCPKISFWRSVAWEIEAFGMDVVVCMLGCSLTHSMMFGSWPYSLFSFSHNGLVSASQSNRGWPNTFVPLYRVYRLLVYSQYDEHILTTHKMLV